MEVTFILNIRERNDCAKDKQSKYRVASTGQHQMVQKFVKELNDSTKQSEQPSNAERTATEQVETTAREIVHEAVQLPRRAIQHTARRESADSLRAVCWIARRGSWTASWTISRAVVSTCSVAVRSALLGCSDCFVLSFNSFTNFCTI